MESLVELPLYLYSAARCAHYSLQFDLLSSLSAPIPGAPGAARKTRRAEVSPSPGKSLLRQEILKLLRQDSRCIAAGLYPPSVLKPEPPLRHLLRIPRIMADGLGIFSRRHRGRTTEFTRSAREQLAGLPRYYRRNFHFQTDGYLSERSAALYEHQVEMLFRGTADAMRRLILPPFKEHFGVGSDGQGLRFLELGAGTGRATRFVQLAFPKARIIAIDLSEAYLMQARKRLRDVSRTGFLQADAGELPFDGRRFDAVYSVFLFHELPMAARKQVLAEARRVLKPGGFFGLVDSIQKGDRPAFEPMLARFPSDYHEPFYRDYMGHPMEELAAATGFKRVRSVNGFFSKAVSGCR